MMKIANRADYVVTTTAVANADARRLTTVANFKAALDLETSAADDTEIASLVYRVSDLIARECGLVETAGGERPTFGNERLTATWWQTGAYRGNLLHLPWRVPVSSITSIVEDGVTLTVSTDYILKSSTPGILVRMDDGIPTAWSSAQIVGVFNAGWTLPTNVPPDVEAAAIEQMRAIWYGRDRDPNLRSESVPDVYTGTWSVGGGDTRGDAALLPQVIETMTPYWNPAR